MNPENIAALDAVVSHCTKVLCRKYGSFKFWAFQDIFISAERIKSRVKNSNYICSRINVLHPPTVPRRTVFLETFDAHGHMYNRCQIMQRSEWRRYHGEWQKPRYGNPSVQESYR